MKSLILFLLLFSGLTMNAQKNSVVILKNGSEIRGQVVHMDSAQTKILAKDGSIWAIENNDIARIDKYQPKVSGKGIYLRAESGVVGGNQISPSIQFINGYTFNPHFDLGLGVGFESFWWDWYVPITANFRWNMVKDKWYTPFIDVTAGYEMPLGNFDNLKGGFTSGAKLGITKNISHRFAFSTSAGYRFAVTKEEHWNWQDFVTIREMHRFELKFGLTFK